jgi:acetyl esterase
MSIHADTKAFLSQAAESAIPKTRDLPAGEARRILQEIAGVLDLPAQRGVDVEELRIPGASDPIGGRLYTPTEIAGNAVLTFFHGGGWVVGSVDTHDSFCRYFADRLKLRVVSVDYRLAPEFPFPSAYDDCMAAVKWLLTSPQQLGPPVEGIGVAGDSTGGNLAAAVSAALGPSVRAQLLFYPVTDISRQSESYADFAEGFLLERADMEYFGRCYTPDETLRSDPRVSPLLAAEFDHLPPSVILTSGLDILRDKGRAYAAKLVANGVTTIFQEAQGYIHGIVTLRGVLPSAIPLLDRCIDDFGRLMLECVSA